MYYVWFCMVNEISKYKCSNTTILSIPIFSYENAILFIFFYYYISWPFLGKEIDLKSINIYNKNNLFKILTSTS